MTTTPFISIQVLARVQKLASAIDKLLMWQSKQWLLGAKGKILLIICICLIKVRFFLIVWFLNDFPLLYKKIIDKNREFYYLCALIKANKIIANLMVIKPKCIKVLCKYWLIIMP
jgi:hypothetical protein